MLLSPSEHAALVWYRSAIGQLPQRPASQPDVAVIAHGVASPNGGRMQGLVKEWVIRLLSRDNTNPANSTQSIGSGTYRTPAV